MQSVTLVLTIKKLWFPNKSVNANCLRLRSKYNNNVKTLVDSRNAICVHVVECKHTAIYKMFTKHMHSYTHTHMDKCQLLQVT